MKFEDLKASKQIIELSDFSYSIYTVKEIFDDYVELKFGGSRSKFTIENNFYDLIDLPYVRSQIINRKTEYYKGKIMDIFMEDDLPKDILNEEYECLRLAVDKFIIEHKRMMKDGI